MSKNSHFTEVEIASGLAAQIRALFGKLKRQLRAQGGQEDLTQSQVFVIIRLEKDGPATVSGLARAEGMRPQSMSAIVTSLQELGLVVGTADPNDGRKTLMSLSKKCEKTLREGRAARQDWLTNAILQKLSAKEQKKILAALKLLSTITEDGPIS